MVSGLLIPTLVAYHGRYVDRQSAWLSMIAGGVSNVLLAALSIRLPFDLDPTLAGIVLAAIVYSSSYLIKRNYDGHH